MSHFPVAPEEIMSAISAGHKEMVTILSVALAIGSDRSVHNRLRFLADASENQPFMVGQLRSLAWLEVGNSLKVHRRRIDSWPSIDLDQARARDPSLAGDLRVAVAQAKVKAAASRLLNPMWDMRMLPSREQYGRLRPWSPLLERLAYKCGAHFMSALDTLRPHILKAPGSGANRASRKLAAYWCGMHIMTHLFFLASEPEAQPWLSEMAGQFTWTTWTPTFPFLRERTMWLAACAARSAIAFGEPVVDKYVDILSVAKHPMKAFDALFGLAAIARGNPATARPILSEIRSLRRALAGRDVPHAEYFEQAYADAVQSISAPQSEELISGPDSRTLGWHERSGQGLATFAALCNDPATMTPSRRFLGFAVLPAIVAAQPEDYYPAAAGTRRSLHINDPEIAGVFFRAWGPSELGEAGPLSH